MKHIYKIIAICLLSLPISMLAQAGEHDMQGMGMHDGMKGMQGMDKHDGMKGGMQGMGMHGDMMADMMSPEHLKQMQAHMLLMHDLSNKILAEKDPKKQQALKDQQLEIMKAHIADRMAKHHKMPPPPPAGANPPPPPPPAH
jgi:hypothetical protein